MYEMEQASDYPGYDGPSVSNGFLEADDDPRPDHDWVADDLDDGFDDGEDFAWFEMDDSGEGWAFDEWLEV